MKKARHLFAIGDHTVAICFSPSESNDISLLPSFRAFAVSDSDQTLLLTLTVDDTLRPNKERQLVRKFDTGNGDTIVFQLPDGGYQFIIRDIMNRDCCLLTANANFSI